MVTIGGRGLDFWVKFLSDVNGDYGEIRTMSIMVEDNTDPAGVVDFGVVFQAYLAMKKLKQSIEKMHELLKEGEKCGKGS